MSRAAHIVITASFNAHRSIAFTTQVGASQGAEAAREKSIVGKSSHRQLHLATMSELAFCKSFLTALDARPVKLSSDHIADARQYPAQGAVRSSNPSSNPDQSTQTNAQQYTLPRLPHPPHPQRPNPKTSANDASSSTGSSTLSISLKPMKPTTPTISLTNIDPSKTSVFDLKSQYASQTSIPAAKIKILYKKKPVTDSKTVAEVIGQDAGADVEFGVMVMGGAVASPAATTPVASPPAAAPSEADKGLASAGSAAVGPSGKEVVATEEFWSDLNNFVLQRIRDEAEGQRLVGVFRSAWEQNK